MSIPARPMSKDERSAFWLTSIRVRGSALPRVAREILIFGAFASLLTYFLLPRPDSGLDVGPVEVAGGALVLLLVLRGNAGYDRWWEGRKLWGGIVNQSRNLAIAGAMYGPKDDPAWSDLFVRTVAAFPHVAKRSLRGERELPELLEVLDRADVTAIEQAQHMPSEVSSRIADLLRIAYEKHGMDRMAFLSAEQQRAQLIDHIGACERILRTPLPLVWVITIRRFVMLYLFFLPIALVHKIAWWTPVLTMLVAYVILAIDRIAVELENPFGQESLNHLPLDDISSAIQGNVLPLATRPRLPDPSETVPG